MILLGLFVTREPVFRVDLEPWRERGPLHRLPRLFFFDRYFNMISTLF